MERVRQLKLCLKRLSRYKKMKGTVSLWLEQEGGGGRWEDLRETQSFQREWRRYYSLLENYKGGGDYRQSPVNARGFIRTLQNLRGVRNQVKFIMTQPKPSRPPTSPDDQ